MTISESDKLSAAWHALSLMSPAIELPEYLDDPIIRSRVGAMIVKAAAESAAKVRFQT